MRLDGEVDLSNIDEVRHADLRAGRGRPRLPRRRSHRYHLPRQHRRTIAVRSRGAPPGPPSPTPPRRLGCHDRPAGAGPDQAGRVGSLRCDRGGRGRPLFGPRGARVMSETQTETATTTGEIRLEIPAAPEYLRLARLAVADVGAAGRLELRGHRRPADRGRRALLRHRCGRRARAPHAHVPGRPDRQIEVRGRARRPRRSPRRASWRGRSSPRSSTSSTSTSTPARFRFAKRA